MNSPLARITHLLVLLPLLMITGAADARVDQALERNGKPTADHGKFEILKKPFATGPEVTEACLSCHTEAAKQLQKTTHWTWEYQHPVTGQTLGKKHELNVFCGSIKSNYQRCTSCHIGYGWKDKDFDFHAERNVDCLVCHDTTGTYLKPEADAGHPAYTDVFANGALKIENGREVKKVDLLTVAQHVGKTSRATCGSCHFYGGGGDGIKHGDLDSSLVNPDHALDVHMDAKGLNFSCATCHTAVEHDVAGSHYSMTARDRHGIDIPGRSHGGRASCESCHGLAPHPSDVNNKLNHHVGKIACQTCHIPAFARGGVPTKTFWDWSKATEKLERDADGNLLLNEKGKPIRVVEYDEQGHVRYASHKGEFRHEENVIPEYHWFDGQIRYTLPDDEIDPGKRVSVNAIEGSYDDPDARIWPFKRMVGTQPYDKKTNRLLAANVYGPDTDSALWSNYDWLKALEVGQAEAVATGDTELAFSGDFGFVENEMYWPITHMVAPKEQALSCAACHSRDGRLANLAGFYMPGRDHSPWLDRIGLVAALGTLGGVLLHLLGRLVVAWRKRP